MTTMTQQLTEIEIDVSAQPAVVWGALTTTDHLERWFCEHADVALDEGRYDFWGRYTPLVPGREQGRHEVLEVRERELLRFAWTLATGTTTVEVTLQATDAGTTVRVLHSDIPRWGRGDAPGWRNVWAFTLEALRTYVELDELPPKFDYANNIRDEINLSVVVHADRRATWQALVEPMLADLRAADAASDESTYAIPDPAHDRFDEVGVKLLELVQDERYAIQWTWSRTKPPVTVLTWTLEDSAGGTRITFVHSGFDPDMEIQGMAQGFFDGLVGAKYGAEHPGLWPNWHARVLRTTV
jgi:uncharacterized protein YndB with AHSA1/START domain